MGGFSKSKLKFQNKRQAKKKRFGTFLVLPTAFLKFTNCSKISNYCGEGAQQTFWDQMKKQSWIEQFLNFIQLFVFEW